MHILIALLPSLLWGAMALLNAAFPAEPRRQNTFVIAGGGAASLLTSPLTGATWSLHSLAWGLLSGLLWSIGIILLLKGFQTWGASRTMPLTAALQLTLNGLIGVVLLGEWRAPGAMALGMGAVALVIAGAPGGHDGGRGPFRGPLRGAGPRASGVEGVLRRREEWMAGRCVDVITAKFDVQQLIILQDKYFLDDL